MYRIYLIKPLYEYDFSESYGCVVVAESEVQALYEAKFNNERGQYRRNLGLEHYEITVLGFPREKHTRVVLDTGTLS